MQLRERLLRSGRLYPYFDYAHGYGIPSAKRLLADSLPEPLADGLVVDFHRDSNLITFQLDSADTTAPLFFHLAGPDGRLLYYAAWAFSPGQHALSLSLDDLLPNRPWPDVLTLRARFCRRYAVASLDIHP